jgi:hypothetical protein
MCREFSRSRSPWTTHPRLPGTLVCMLVVVLPFGSRQVQRHLVCRGPSEA